MNESKIKIIAIAGASILSVLIGYFIWVIFLKTPQPKSKQISAPAFKSGEVTIPKSSSIEGLNIPILPIPKPNIAAFPKEKSLPTSTTSFFENINKAAKAVETKLKNEIATSTQTVPNAPSNANISKPAPTEIILSLTNDEFHYLYPDAFIASLMDAQNSLIKGYDPAYVPLSKIETDSQVRFVEEKIVTAALSANIITKNEAERFITTIRFTLPQLQLMELKNRASYSLFKGAPSALLKDSQQSPPKASFLAGLLEKLRDALIYPAQAICGACFDVLLCYQFGTPGPGLIIFRIACYCTGCLYGQGCLDFCTGSPAIYDPETGICGCAVEVE